MRDKSHSRKHRGRIVHRRSKWREFLSLFKKKPRTKQIRTWAFYIAVTVLSFVFAYYYLAPMINAGD